MIPLGLLAKLVPAAAGVLRGYWPVLVGLALCAAWALHAHVLTGRIAAARADAAQARADLADERAARALERAEVERVAREIVEQYRAREQAVAAELDRIKEQAHADLTRAARDAADARAAADRLRVAAARAARAAASGGSDPATSRAAAEGGAPAAGPGLVLADLLGRCGARAVELGEAVDRSRAAGLACERAYDALTAHEAPR
jgi:hypothetical protein